MQSIEIHIETLLRRHPELAPAAPAIRETIEMILAAFRAGNTLFCCGNGGSAADADHICGEFLKGFLLRRELPAAEQKHFTEKFGAEGSELAADSAPSRCCRIRGSPARSAMTSIPFWSLLSSSTRSDDGEMSFSASPPAAARSMSNTPK